MMDLQKEIEIAINCASRENESDTPDFILAEYLMGCLRLYEKAVRLKEPMYLEPSESATAETGFINNLKTPKIEIKEMITAEQEDLFAKFKKEKPEILHTDTGICIGDKKHRIKRMIKYLRRTHRW